MSAPCTSGELPAYRSEEIRQLIDQLAADITTPPTDPEALRMLLTRCRRALVDVVHDRDHLVTSHAALAEELAAWNGLI